MSSRCGSARSASASPPALFYRTRLDSKTSQVFTGRPVVRPSREGRLDQPSQIMRRPSFQMRAEILSMDISVPRACVQDGSQSNSNLQILMSSTELVSKTARQIASRKYVNGIWRSSPLASCCWFVLPTDRRTSRCSLAVRATMCWWCGDLTMAKDGSGEICKSGKRPVHCPTST
jgi:hypothetical protein